MIGLTSYCCKFIPAYDDLIRPSTKLTYETVPFTWTGQYWKVIELPQETIIKNSISGVDFSYC